MEELTLAGNKVFSKKMDDDDILPFKLRVYGYEEFDKLYQISSENNMFKTPTNFLEPENGPGYQYVASIPDYNEYICDVINSKLNSNMKVVDCWFLHQTNDAWVDNPKHTHMTADWISVTYLDIKDGDAIQFFDEAGNMEEYCPVFGETIFFPSTAIHKPKPNSSSKRLTLNAELAQTKSQEEVEEIENRFTICKSCDRFDESTKNCSECGCFIPMKIGLISESCPADKW